MGTGRCPVNQLVGMYGHICYLNYIQFTGDGRSAPTFEQADGRLRGEGEGVQGAGDVQQALEVLGHVVPAHRADVVDGLGGYRRQRLLPETLHQVVQHRVWGGGGVTSNRQGREVMKRGKVQEYYNV